MNSAVAVLASLFVGGVVFSVLGVTALYFWDKRHPGPGRPVLGIAVGAGSAITGALAGLAVGLALFYP